MNLIVNINQFDNRSVYFCEPIKNNIVKNSDFIRILYLTQYMSLNGLYLFIHLSDVICEKYNNKYKYSFNVSNNFDIIEKIKAIEMDILNKYYILKQTKNPSYDIYEMIKNGNIKHFTNFINLKTKQDCSFLLKISGLWETNDKYGLAYKFQKVTTNVNTP
jgi:hypothetical protein